MRDFEYGRNVEAFGQRVLCVSLLGALNREICGVLTFAQTRIRRASDIPRMLYEIARMFEGKNKCRVSINNMEG